jgi:hypothetical protein
VDQEVAKTLGELELKLQELERELTTIGGRKDAPQPPGRLVDEAVEAPQAEVPTSAPVSSPAPQETAYGEIPHQPGPEGPTASPYVPPLPPPLPVADSPPGPLTDEHTVDVVALVQFRDKLATTMDALLDEYSRLLGLDRPPRPH